MSKEEFCIISTGVEMVINLMLIRICHYRRHDQTRCVCCEIMEDGLKTVKISKTGREYVIKRHYTCLDTYVVYLATSLICQSQYVGQTIKEMRRTQPQR